MSYTLRVRGIEIGTSDLEFFDSRLGIAHGGFRPSAGYGLVQEVFRSFTEALSPVADDPAEGVRLERYLQVRDALGLDLIDARRHPVGTSAIDISDYSREPGPQAFEVMVYLDNPDQWPDPAR